MVTRRLSALLAAVLIAPLAHAQDAQTLVQQAVKTELAADAADHSLWHYKMSEKAGENSVYDVCDTANGSVRQKIEQDGHPVSPDVQRAEAAKVQAFVGDTRAQAKQRRDGAHDDESAQKMLNLLPVAFLWTLGDTKGEDVTLHFTPNPNFKAPDIESRVLGAMKGDLVVDRTQHRIATIRGTLTHDVEIGYGILGKLRQGGTFNVERRQLSPGVWQITETHVHIDGRALLFKTIGQQQDEIKYDFHRIPEATTLAQAAVLIAQP